MIQPIHSSYNGRSEVTGVQRYHGTDVSDRSTVYGGRQFGYAYDPIGSAPSEARRFLQGEGTDTGDTSETVDGQQYAYAFDPIGNRITAAEGDTSRTATYTANELNQYSQRTIPGVKELARTALTNATVTVNELPTDRYGPWWRHAFEVDNASAAAAYTQAVVTAVYNPPGTNDPDVVTSQTGRVFVAETPEAFTYDHDGNLTQDGRFDYTWNGENRLIKAETRNDLPVDVPRVRVDYAYDHQGRMVWKQVSTNSVVLSTRTLICDGYNIVQETINNQQSTITNAYVWGLDLSGSLQGAGGVGGLLAEVQNGEPYFAAFDANGNVTEYISADGTLPAHYEYSPFGEIVVQSGDLADVFTHRFSAKQWCATTELSEYLFRKYSPHMGRWLSRDPLGEMVDANVYGYVWNTPMGVLDPLGLAGETRPGGGFDPKRMLPGLIRFIIEKGLEEFLKATGDDITYEDLGTGPCPDGEQLFLTRETDVKVEQVLHGEILLVLRKTWERPATHTVTRRWECLCACPDETGKLNNVKNDPPQADHRGPGGYHVTVHVRTTTNMEWWCGRKPQMDP